MNHLSCFCFFCLAIPATAESANPFKILVQREKTDCEGLVIGKLFVNGKELGPVYENDSKKVPVGTYSAHLRYESGKNHVQGPGGLLGKKGDFLVELDKFKQGDVFREFVQFHAGSKAEDSDGCFLCEAAVKTHATGSLRKLRLEFYDGQDEPIATPNKIITVEVKDPPTK